MKMGSGWIVFLVLEIWKFEKKWSGVGMFRVVLQQWRNCGSIEDNGWNGSVIAVLIYCSCDGRHTEKMRVTLVTRV